MFFRVLYTASIEVYEYIDPFPAYYFFNGLLLILQVLHIIWTYMIARIAIDAGKGKVSNIFEPRREKTGYLHMLKTKTQISIAVTAKLISAFVFATRLVQSLYFLDMKFLVSSHLVWLYSLVCVRPGRKPRRPIFSERGSFYHYVPHLCSIL